MDECMAGSRALMILISSLILLKKNILLAQARFVCRQDVRAGSLCSRKNRGNSILETVFRGSTLLKGSRLSLHAFNARTSDPDTGAKRFPRAGSRMHFLSLPTRTAFSRCSPSLASVTGKVLFSLLAFHLLPNLQNMQNDSICQH